MPSNRDSLMFMDLQSESGWSPRQHFMELLNLKPPDILFPAKYPVYFQVNFKDKILVTGAKLKNYRLRYDIADSTPYRNVLGQTDAFGNVLLAVGNSVFELKAHKLFSIIQVILAFQFLH